MPKVIAPTDFSPAAEPGLHRARDYARQSGMPLVLVHVWDRDALALHAPYLKTVQAENVAMLREIEQSLKERLEAAARTLGSEPPDLQTHILHDRSPARAIASLAEPDDVIVISTHGRTGLSRVLLGSVAEKVVRLARCPVLTVPSAPVVE